jgi:hypothetical protein
VPPHPQCRVGREGRDDALFYCSEGQLILNCCFEEHMYGSMVPLPRSLMSGARMAAGELASGHCHPTGSAWCRRREHMQVHAASAQVATLK